MMSLIPVANVPDAIGILYELLKERPPEAGISHKAMPTYEQHEAFVRSGPYRAWYLLQVDGAYVGSVYLTKASEVGIFIFRAHHRKGYGRQAIALLREHHPGRILANIAPGNAASLKFFKELGAVKIQETFLLE